MSDTSAYIQRFLVIFGIFLQQVDFCVDLCYAFLPKCFSQFLVTVDANVELLGSIHPSHMSQARYLSRPRHDVSTF